jgi:AcrR family transcriptional regulator
MTDPDQSVTAAAVHRSLPGRDRGRGGTRAELLEATEACLAEHGLAGTTSRAIAARAGANLAAITYHFGSKDALVAEALLASVRRWLDPVLTVLRSEGEPAERTVRAVAALQSSLADARATLPLHLSALTTAPRNPALRAGLDELLGEVHELLAGQIADQVASGYLPPWIDPGAMAHLLVAMADGIALHAVLQPEAVDPGALVAQALALLLAARDGGR